MSTSELREELKQFIENEASDEQLEYVLSVIHGLKEEDPVLGYKPDGTPITRSQIVQGVEEARERYSKGEYYTVEQARERLLKKK